MSDEHVPTGPEGREWKEPLSESPVELQPGWHGGGVVHTGGGIWARIWRTTKSESTYTGDEILVIAYTLHDPGVGLIRKTWDAGLNGYVTDETLTERRVEEIRDMAMAAKARELMEKYG